MQLVLIMNHHWIVLCQSLFATHELRLYSITLSEVLGPMSLKYGAKWPPKMLHRHTHTSHFVEFPSLVWLLMWVSYSRCARFYSSFHSSTNLHSFRNCVRPLFDVSKFTRITYCISTLWQMFCIVSFQVSYRQKHNLISDIIKANVFFFFFSKQKNEVCLFLLFFFISLQI